MFSVGDVMYLHNKGCYWVCLSIGHTKGNTVYFGRTSQMENPGYIDHIMGLSEPYSDKDKDKWFIHDDIKINVSNIYNIDEEDIPNLDYDDVTCFDNETMIKLRNKIEKYNAYQRFDTTEAP